MNAHKNHLVSARRIMHMNTSSRIHLIYTLKLTLAGNNFCVSLIPTTCLLRYLTDSALLQEKTMADSRSCVTKNIRDFDGS